ncbi:MAG: hypothetical protein WC532_00755 [Candidatus Omnitrophota bacterium]
MEFQRLPKNRLESVGVSSSVIEKMVDDDKTLCIIADLANGLKHAKLRKSRSYLYPKLQRSGFIAEQGDIDAIVVLKDKVHIQFKNNNSIKPSTLVVSSDGKELGKAEDIALNAIDSWLRIAKAMEKYKIGDIP